MMRIRPGWFVASVAALIASLVFRPAGSRVSAQSDLDALMREVLARRDDNWKKLQQYVLDEREEVELRGPLGPLWGERKEFTWYVRDGFFVRSPLRVNSAAVGESDRREYEANYLRRVQRRDRRQQQQSQGDQAPAAPEEAPQNVDALIRQTRQPQFISSAYFLRFRFEEGHYALVGPEKLDGFDVLRIEYYPTKLFADSEREIQRRQERGRKPDLYEEEIQRLMNKSSLVTLWVEPKSHQIIKYTFDNLGLEFLPVQWLVRVTDARASMTMSQPFPDVWLPKELDVRAAVALAIGQIDFRYGLSYYDYRQADVRSTIIVPE
jgi:hypothetical protein